MGEQGGKRVRWKETLLEVRDISPRENKGRFRYPKSNRKPSTSNKIDSEVGQFSTSWSSNGSKQSKPSTLTPTTYQNTLYKTTQAWEPAVVLERRATILYAT